MRRIMMFLMVMGLVDAHARSDDKPAPKADPAAAALESLTNEFAAAQSKFMQQVRSSAEAAKKSGSPPKPVSFEDSPGPLFSPRFLAVAEQNLGNPVGFQAILGAVQTSGGPSSKGGTWAKAMMLLKDHYATKPEIKPLLRALGSTNDADAENLLRAVIATNADRKLQATACKSLADGCDSIAEMIVRLNQDASLRRNFESVRGKDYVAKLLASGENRKKEAAELRKMLHDKYADLITDVSIGKPAPEIVSRDLDGKEAKLSALKGNVVVLDVWATWCGPCRAMIPHEREMVERLKDKPFALISISADEKIETLKEFLSNEKMPWTHWWNGSQGGMIEDWNIEKFPTIYVIDAEGVIRYIDKRGEELEEAVNALLKDTGPKKAG